MKRVCCLLLAALLLPTFAAGQEAVSPDVLKRGRVSVQFLSGYYVWSGLGPGRPFGSTIEYDFDYAPISARVGYLLTGPSERNHLFRGATEILAELTVAPVVNGFADIAVGPSILLRYNFIQPGARLIPYVQAGAGLVYSDGYKTEGQDALGQAVEFLLQTQVGFRWFVSENWSVDLEAGYQHISNAGMTKENGGINDFGGSIGITYLLPLRGP